MLVHNVIFKTLPPYLTSILLSQHFLLFPSFSTLLSIFLYFDAPASFSFFLSPLTFLFAGCLSTVAECLLFHVWCQSNAREWLYPSYDGSSLCLSNCWRVTPPSSQPAMATNKDVSFNVYKWTISQFCFTRSCCKALQYLHHINPPLKSDVLTLLCHCLLFQVEVKVNINILRK